MKSHAWDFRTTALLIASYLALQFGSGDAHAVDYHVLNPTELVLAINAANSSTTPSVIFLFPREYRLPNTFDTAFGPSALPPIRSNITLVGRDAPTTILLPVAPSAHHRIITVVPGGRLTVRKVTLTGGDTDSLVAFPGNGGAAAGNFAGFLRFQDCVITGNDALSEQTGEEGGGILSFNGRLEVIRTTISDNITSGDGGGIALLGGSGVIRDSIISGNEAEGLGTTRGGGIIVSGTLGIYGSTIVGNAGFSDFDDAIAEGGGIYISAGTVVMADSAVVGNTTSSPEFGAGSGGGIYNAGTLSIKNGTAGGNSAGTSGGGIYNRGVLRLQGVTVVDNEAKGDTLPLPFFDNVYPRGCDVDNAPELCITGGGGVWNQPSARMTIMGTVIANNRIEVLAQMLAPDCGGTFTSQGHNAVSTDVDCVLKPVVKGANTHDLIDVDPRLAALADDGTAGNAHYPLRAGSPLIDAGDVVGPRCTFADQLGQRRLDGDHEGNVLCDIGAIEFNPTSQ